MSASMTSRKIRQKRRDHSEAPGHRCCYCGVVMTQTKREMGRKNRWRLATLEHLKPMCENGGWTHDNLVAACMSCNTGRLEGITAEQFYDLRQKTLLAWPAGTRKPPTLKLLSGATGSHVIT